MRDMSAAFTSLFKVNMGVHKGERIVVFSDLIRNDEIPDAADSDRRRRLHDAACKASAYADAAFGRASFIDFPATPASGAEPPEALWIQVFGNSAVQLLKSGGLLEKLLLKEASAQELEEAKRIIITQRADSADVIIAMSNNSTSHTRFRHLANLAGARFASLPHFDPEMFFTSMTVNWQQLAERTSRLAELVNRGEALVLSTANGTSLSFSSKGRVAEGDDGLLTTAGSFGNLPAGEVYLAPLEGSAEGELVIEYGPTRKLDSPLRLMVSGGEVVEIKGDDPHRKWLEEKFSASRKNRNIAELGIGTNDKATRPDNILEAEKILGTVHVALGDNSGFGGVVSTPFHEDYVFYRPTLSVVLADGSRVPLLEDGTLCLLS